MVAESSVVVGGTEQGRGGQGNQPCAKERLRQKPALRVEARTAGKFYDEGA